MSQGGRKDVAAFFSWGEVEGEMWEERRQSWISETATQGCDKMVLARPFLVAMSIVALSVGGVEGG